MSPNARRIAIREAAERKWDDKRIALIEHADGGVEIRALTGDYDWRFGGPHHIIVKEKAKVYWSGRSLDEAAKAVGL